MILNNTAENIFMHISRFTDALISLGCNPDRGKVHVFKFSRQCRVRFSTVAVQDDPPTVRYDSYSCSTVSPTLAVAALFNMCACACT